MKKVSVQDLKATLSSAIAEAEAGHTVVITRHNEPVASLGPVGTERVVRGSRVGAAPLRAAVGRGSKGRYLSVLADDRGSR